MCYNFATSIISYTLGIVAAAISLIYKKFELGILILFYSQMQLSEAIIWRGIDTNNTSLNKFGTSFGKYLLATHNIAIGIGIILAALYHKNPITLYRIMPLIIGIIFFGWVCYIYKNTKSSSLTYPLQCKDRSCQNPNNRLRWPYPHGWYIVSFIISLILLFIYIEPPQSKIFLSVSFTSLLMLTFITHPQNVGSVWCFSTALFAPFLSVGNILL